MGHLHPIRRVVSHRLQSADSGRWPYCHHGDSLPSRPGELHPEPLTDPDLILSHHPARATVRRLPPSVACQVPPVAG